MAEAKELIYGCSQAAAATSCPPPPPSPKPPLTSTLVVCPHIATWSHDFQAFDDFVKNVRKEDDEELLFQQVTLVSFAPQFLRWRGLAAGIQVGSMVQSHKGIARGFSQKSVDVFPATVLETSNPVFGQRRIKIRFHRAEDDNDEKAKEQYVPVDWIVVATSCVNGGDDDDKRSCLGPPLPDNAMHRAPFPTIHLIRNEDLVIPCRHVSRVKRKESVTHD